MKQRETKRIKKETEKTKRNEKKQREEVEAT